MMLIGPWTRAREDRKQANVADPEEIQREIEATRAELAATVEKIADKVSPKKVAARGAATAKDKAMTAGLNAYVKVEQTFAPQPPGAVEPLPVSQRIKWERVAAAVAALSLLVTVLVRRRSHSKQRQLRKPAK